MTLWEITKEAIRENLLLIRDPDRYRAVLSVRIIVLLVLGTAIVAVFQIIQGKITFDMGFVLGLFAIFISWLFFWSADKISRTQITQLQTFLKDFREESTKGFDVLGRRMSDVESIFKDHRSPPTPPPPAPSPSEEPPNEDSKKAEELFAEALSEVMKEGPKQVIVAINVSKRPIPLDMHLIEYHYETKKGGSHNATMVTALARELRQLGMVEFDHKTGAICLSDRGKSFAQWLEDNGHKATFFECPMLGISWGEPSDQFKKFMDDLKKNKDG